MLFPVPGGRLDRDSMGDPRAGHQHRGQDIGARPGTPIYAAVSGRVDHITSPDSPIAGQRACGWGVIIDDREGVRWTYCHMPRRPMVLRGDYVHAGDQIGVVGSTGSSTGPHLHIQAVTDHGHGEAINLYRPLVAARDMVGPPHYSARHDALEPDESAGDTPASSGRAALGPLVLAALAAYYFLGKRT